MLRRLTFCLFLASVLIVSGCKISGTITDEEGGGLGDVTVVLSGKINMSTETNSQGYYEFNNWDITSGTYTVTPSSTGLEFNPASKTINLPFLSNSEGNNFECGLEIKLEAEGSIGPGGGILEVTDTESRIYSTAILIPQGALSEETNITISSGYDFIDFGPDGTVFDAPVSIVMYYHDEDNDGLLDGTNVPEEEIKAVTFNEAIKEWESELFTQDTDLNMVLIQAYHFSKKDLIAFNNNNTLAYSVLRGAVNTVIGTITENGVGLEGATVTISGEYIETKITNTDSNGKYYFPSIFFNNGSNIAIITPSLNGYTFNPPNISDDSNCSPGLYGPFSSPICSPIYANFEGQRTDQSCTDNDGDNYGAIATSQCDHPELDCDDNDLHVNPGATEDCYDGKDNDCNGYIDSADPACHSPSVISFFPANGAIGVDINTAITVTFSEEIDPSTITDTTFYVNGVTGSRTYSGRTATFTPSVPLNENTTYNVTVTDGIVNLAGSPLGADSCSFTTSSISDLPDLIISDLEILLCTVNGIQYRCTVKNIGTVSSNLNGLTSSITDNVFFQAYRSNDTVYDPTFDIAAGGRICRGILNPGESVTYTFGCTSIAIPFIQSTYLVMKVDQFNHMEESDETNNTIATLIDTVQPCTDVDHDGYFAEEYPGHYSYGCGTKVDCNDGNSNVYPGATEICNDGVDNNCNDGTDCSDDVCRLDPVCLPKSISGSIQINGTGLEGVTVTLSGDTSGSTLTDNNGNYIFENLTSGSYIVTPYLLDYAFDPGMRDVEIIDTNMGEIYFTAYSLDDGLVAYYPFNGNPDDESGNANHGTEYGGISYETGVIDQAAKFDGGDDYIDGGNNPILDITNAISISAWAKPAQLSVGGYLVAKGSYFNYSMGITSHPMFRSSINGVHFDTTYILDYSWKHYVFTYDRSQEKLIQYINGTKVLETSYSEYISTSSDNLQIGRRLPDSYYFNGLIDEIRIYNRALLEAEIQVLYSAMSSNTVVFLNDYEVTGNSGDVVHLGDQTIVDDSFIQPAAQGTTWSANFDVQAAPTGGEATIYIDHFQADPDMDYYSHIYLNGYERGTLSDSTDCRWCTDEFIISTDDLLNSGGNTITVEAGVNNSGSNWDDFEFTNFYLIYPVP